MSKKQPINSRKFQMTKQKVPHFLEFPQMCANNKKKYINLTNHCFYSVWAE